MIPTLTKSEVKMSHQNGGLEGLWADLMTHFGPRASRDEPLSAHTTLRLGGPADIWFPAKSVAELITAVNLARQHRVPVFMLGGGANLLIQDRGIRGLVIENRADSVAFTGTTVLAESGAVNPRLARRCAQQGLSGLEWIIGVPGTIGGAVVNNAGAYGRSMADSLLRAELLEPSGARVWQPVAWFEYAYRLSRIKRMTGEKPIVLQVELALEAKPPADIEATMQQFNERRRATQPPGATIGSMFKNPPGDFAGRLIEAAGLKEYRVNQAQISPLHANFFLNLGNAKADDVLTLIAHAQHEVQRQFGVMLDLEIEII